MNEVVLRSTLNKIFKMYLLTTFEDKNQLK